MNIYLLDKNLKVCDTLSSEGGVNSSPFFNDEYIQYLETGAETFEFETLNSVYLENGNYVAFMYKNEYKLFQISEVEDTHDDAFIKRVYSETSGLELSYEIIRPRVIPSANIKQFLEIVLADTSWEIGNIDEDVSDVHTIEIDNYDRIYDVIQENIKLYNCEISFRIDMKGGRVTHKYIDVHKQRGNVTNYRFEYGKNVNGIVRKVNSFDLCTALIGIGKDSQTFKDAEWSIEKGDPANKPLNQDFIVDEVAYKKYNVNGSHLMGVYECDLESPYDILAATYKELQERKEPKTEYEIDISLFNIDDIDIGDEVYVIDNDWKSEPLHLSARANEVHLSFTNTSNYKCVVSNFKKVKSKIEDNISGILNRIPESSTFMGISKGGLLSSVVETDGFDINIKNKLVNENGKEYFIRVKEDQSNDFMKNILTKDSRYITQSFAIDFEESCIYTSQVVTETSPEHILLSKIGFNGSLLGYMRLHGFGHGSQIGIDKLDGVTKIWCECYGEPHVTTGKLFGTKICRFTFESGKEYTTSAGNVFDMITDARNIQVAVNQQSNRLSIKYITYSNKNAINVYDLKSVISNNPRMLASFTIPSWLETSISPNQGHAVYGNRIYHYEGGDSSTGSDSRITVLDFDGNVLDTNITKDGINLPYREPEGLFAHENNGVYELYAGISEGNWPNRKFHIFKYVDAPESDFEKRGTFVHNNGHMSSIDEVVVNTGFNGGTRKKVYLLYTDKIQRKFIIGSYRNGKWWVDNKEYTPGINDAVIAEIREQSNKIDVSVMTTNYESVKGEDGQDGANGDDAYTVILTNESYTFNAQNDGNIPTAITTTTDVVSYKGTLSITPIIGDLPSISGLTLSKSGTTITIQVDAGTSLTDTGSINIPIIVDGKSFTKTFSWSKAKQGTSGTDGTNGVDGTSPVLVTINGQQSMKYLDKTTAPTPSTITLTANVMEGNTVISSGVTYLWQYKNSSGTWVNLSGTNNAKTYSLVYSNGAFVNDIAQIRVVVSYKSQTYYLEHTVTKIYDNKYISKQEIFDKVTEGGTNQLIYKDPDTGEIYINATYIKTGQFVADLIKGGLLTLGGTGNSDTGDYGRFRVLDSSGQNELASLDGGEMRMVNLQTETLNTTDLNVKNINCVTYAPAVYEYTKVYVNTSSGNDDVEFESGAIYKTLQGALDAAPKNLNGFTTEIVLQTAVSENLIIRGFSGGTLNILMNSNNINGYIVIRDCSAQVFLLGGLTTTDIADGISNTNLRPNIQPSSLFSYGGYNYSVVAIGCSFVYIRSIDIFGKTGTTTNYCVGSVNASNVYVQNVNAYASNSGYNVQVGAKLTTRETYGRCERLAYNVQTGGVAHICDGNSTGAPTNIYTGNGGQVIQGNVTFIGDSTSVGSNDNTTTNNTSTTLTATYGDTYKVKYSSWRKDNTVRQGDWASTGMNKGCWFFGNQFNDIKGKTIKSIKLTIQRQSAGGNSGAVAFTLKMHNHAGRPSGAPSYLSGWSKNVSLSIGQSSTITITDSAVLTAIKNGTMKGFGVEVSSTSNSYYGILSPKLKAVITYS